MPRGAKPGDGRMAAAIAAAAAVKRAETVARIDSGKKWCPRCHKWLSPDAFGRNQSSPDGFAAYCRDDMNTWSRAYRRRLAEEAADESRRIAIVAARQAAAAARCETAETRAAAVAARWRLGVSFADGLRVAALVETPVPKYGHDAHDRVQAVAFMSGADLLALARRAGVTPGSAPPERICNLIPA